MKPSDVKEFKNGGGSTATLDELLDRNLVHHLPAQGLPPGPGGFKAIASSIFAAFPDVHVTTEMMLEEGKFVMERSFVQATHTGPFQNIAATGKK